MAITPVPEVIVTPIAYFPEKYFLENLIVRTDGSEPVNLIVADAIARGIPHRLPTRRR
jgi:hypothetical protein